MNVKHTPGPWNIGPIDPNGWNCVVAPGGVEVATIWVSPDLSDIDDATSTANAHLMAAAPEMLADLCEAAATLRRYEALHRAKNTEDSLSKAEVNAALAARFEATIAKAT